MRRPRCSSRESSMAARSPTTGARCRGRPLCRRERAWRSASGPAIRQIPTSGGSIQATSRYLQYRATLATADPGTTPELQQVAVQYGVDAAPADTVPPVISGVAASAAGATSAVVTWNTDEIATSRVDY